MRLKIHLLVFAIIAINSVNLSGQSSFNKGFIVTNQGDTISGFIGRLGENSNYKTCYFKKELDGRITKYGPDEIRSFGSLYDWLFISNVFETNIKKLEPAFVQVVAQEVSEFKVENETDYKGISLYNLKGVYYIDAPNGLTYVLDRKKEDFKRILNSLLANRCFELSSIVSKTNLTEKALVNVLDRYGKCVGVSFNFYSKKESTNSLELGFEYVNATHSSRKAINYPEFENVNPTSSSSGVFVDYSFSLDKYTKGKLVHCQIILNPKRYVRIDEQITNNQRVETNFSYALMNLHSMISKNFHVAEIFNLEIGLGIGTRFYLNSDQQRIVETNLGSGQIQISDLSDSFQFKMNDYYTSQNIKVSRTFHKRLQGHIALVNRIAFTQFLEKNIDNPNLNLDTRNNEIGFQLSVSYLLK